MLAFGLSLQYGDLSLEIGRLYVSDQSPLKTRVKAFFYPRDIARRAIRGENYLLLSIIKGIKSVKELFLGPFLACDELNVVD